MNKFLFGIVTVVFLATGGFFIYTQLQISSQTARWSSQIAGDGYWLTSNNQYIESIDLNYRISGTVVSLFTNESGNLVLNFIDTLKRVETTFELPSRAATDSIFLWNIQREDEEFKTLELLDIESALEYLALPGTEFELTIIYPISGSNPKHIQDITIIL